MGCSETPVPSWEQRWQGMGGEGEEGSPAPTCQPQVEVPLQLDSVPTRHSRRGEGGRAAGDCLPLNARADLSVFQDVDGGVERPRQEGGVMAGPAGTLIWTRSGLRHPIRSSSPHPSCLSLQGPHQQAHGYLLIRASHSPLGRRSGTKGGSSPLQLIPPQSCQLGPPQPK